MAEEVKEKKKLLDKLADIIFDLNSADQDLATLEVVNNKAAKDRAKKILMNSSKRITSLMLDIDK